MNKSFKSFLQVGFSLALGVFLIWYFYKDLTEENKEHIVESFRKANYWWILASIFIAIMSHVFRAYRWKYTLQPLNIKINFINRFAAVMIGYIANLAFPRLGEVSRCAVLARYQNQPFEKLFGTVVAERVIDAVILLILIIVTTLLQFSVLGPLVMEFIGPMTDKIQNQILLGVLAIIAIIGLFFGWKFLQRSQHKVALAIRSRVLGLWEGIVSLKTMEGKFGFYLHTALIWASYVLMYLVTFNAFSETQEVAFAGVLASFVMGGITIVVVQGGLGAYPLGIMSILLLYGIEKELGYAFGWIVWCAQTAMILVLGFISILIMPFINQKTKDA